MSGIGIAMIAAEASSFIMLVWTVIGYSIRGRPETGPSERCPATVTSKRVSCSRQGCLRAAITAKPSSG